jgi:hypothetical protein
MIKIVKNVKDEYVNKLTTLKLTAYNGKMLTINMIKSKSLEYLKMRVFFFLIHTTHILRKEGEKTRI